jgi:hypothetical protein
VLQLLKLPDGTVKVLVEGTARARISAFTERAEFHEVRADVLPEPDEEEVELGRGRIYDVVVDTERTGVDHRPVGGALLGVGAVMLTAGVTMLVVDLVRSKKRQQAGLAHPLLGPNLVGLGYSARF